MCILIIDLMPPKKLPKLKTYIKAKENSHFFWQEFEFPVRQDRSQK